MNGITREIAERFGIDLEEALKVQDYMDSHWLIEHYSEATREELDTAYDEAYAATRDGINFGYRRIEA